MAYRRGRCRLVTKSWQVAAVVARPITNPVGARRQRPARDGAKKS